MTEHAAPDPFADFDGLWIAMLPDLQPITPPDGDPAPYFRKAFHLDAPPVKAEIRFCGLGYGELRVNGRKVSDDVLQPPFTRYDARFLYSTYDVTDLLAEGDNVVGAIVGNGMYNVIQKNPWNFDTAPWRSLPKMALSARIELADGRVVRFRSDTSFRVARGPILWHVLHEGEYYDARLEREGWDRPGFDDRDFGPVFLCRPPGGVPMPMDMEPCRVVRRLRAKSLREVRPGVWLYDFGENIAGWPALRVRGPAGTAVTLRCTEKLGADGDLDGAPVHDFVEAKERFQADTYLLSGRGDETWEPRFVYHGFQYVRLEGFPGTPDLDSVAACEVHTDLPDRGHFACSDPLAEQIHAAVRLATLGNWHGMPTDCPHREKNGWTGDAALSAEQALLNFDPSRAYRKWLRDMTDCQRPDGRMPGIVPTGGWGFEWGNGPAWDDALVLIPWYLYLYEGDRAILETMVEPIRRYLDSVARQTEDGIIDFGLGDWCPPEGGFATYKCPVRVSDTAIHATQVRTLSRILRVLGQGDAARRYETRADAVGAAFRKAFTDEATGWVEGDCQTSYACALYHGLLAGETARKAFDRLVGQVERFDRHIDCGILGAKYILRVLTDWGRPDLAWAMVTHTTFPGWGHWIAQGATTLWETWDGEASRNHHMFSDVGAWFHSGLAGIRPDPENPGFRHTIFRPRPDAGPDQVLSRHRSPQGEVYCGFRRDPADGDGGGGDGDRGRWIVEAGVPEGCTGTLYLPDGFADRTTLVLNGAIRLA